ncbi:Crp/Fnr family transcriptional regulator [Aureispira sp. CCB-E]|uniref:Crp/Fnr family transcriptional regulator n=1 Tax=Aureispira sp. CCB-E TaxID=3051121 RepID=UPI0028690825|nr:Crp/Fnr family transcriptional regulator [Aureispira sp. CCB-E]WMX15166.1 Crp/Fnr family transcriptional regulator [Aureispira sp. CCB-E]
MEELKAVIQQLVPLNAVEWQALTALFRLEQWKKNSYFAQEGRYARRFAFVQSGTLRAFYRNAKGEEYNKTFFTSRHFVGAFSSLISKDINLINIQCLTPCELFVAEYRSFTNLFEQYPNIERIARLLAEQFFIRKEKREIELVMLEAKERYAIFQEEHPYLEQQIPQYHIASYLGISATQLSRIRGERKLK